MVKIIEDATIRETVEEITVSPHNIKQLAILNFYFPYVDKPEKWNQQVDEIAPKWFPINEISLKAMWDDAHI